MDASTAAEVCGVHPDCEHRTLIHLAESPLWVCTECEGQMSISAWRELKGTAQ